MIKIIIFALAVLCVCCLCIGQLHTQKTIDELFELVEELMQRKDQSNDSE